MAADILGVGLEENKYWLNLIAMELEWNGLAIIPPMPILTMASLRITRERDMV